MRHRRGRSRSLGFLAVLTCVVPGPCALLAAQSTLGMRAGVAAAHGAAPAIDSTAMPRDRRALFAPAVNAVNAANPVNTVAGARVTPTWTRWSPVASAVVPGAGQFMLGDDRFVAYAAVEAITWFEYLKDQQDQRHQEATFKDIARRVARAHFSTAAPDSSWSYYEAMRDYQQSGVYSETDVGPVVPETDTTTYNGFKWLIEVRTHATYAEALAAYERDAIRPAYQWSWVNASFGYDLFARTTEKRNSAFRRSARDLTILGVNHILSMIDAFATVRLTAVATPDGGAGLGASVRW